MSTKIVLLADTEILRAVTAQQPAILKAAKSASPKTFFRDVSGLQRAFAKAYKKRRED